MDNEKNNFSEFVFMAGIDWASEKHDYKILDNRSGKKTKGTIENSSEALEAWILRLEEKSQGKKIAICLEECNGMLLHKFINRPTFVIYSLNPAMAANYRQAFFPSNAKSDIADADLLLEMLIMHRDRLRVWEPDTEAVRALNMLVKQRRKLVDHRTKLIQKLYAEIKRFYPQAITLVGETFGCKMSCDFLRKWSSVKTLKRAKEATLRKFYYAHNCRSETLVKKRIELIKELKLVSNEDLIIQASELIIQGLVSEINVLNIHVEKHEKLIDEIFKQHEDSEIFSSLPGAGRALAPRMLAAIGTKRENFKSANELQMYTGIAPVIISSGKKKITLRRRKTSKFLLQTFHEFAGHSTAFSAWAKAYYKEAEARGQRHNVIVRALGKRHC